MLNKNASQGTENDKNQQLKKIREELIKKGKKSGLLTYKEIIEALQELDLSPEEIDDFYDHLSHLGVDVVDDTSEEEEIEPWKATTKKKTTTKIWYHRSG